MTLTVARVTPRGVWLTSDMRITDPSAVKTPGFLGAALKLVLLSPTFCVGYSGRVSSAIPAIKEVLDQDMPPNRATELLLRIHREDPGVDFVAARIDPSALVAIKDGCATLGEAAWIGDPDAFNRYQELFHHDQFATPSDGLDPTFADDLRIAVPMNDAMQDLVLASPELDAPEEWESPVGEASVTVGPRASDGLLGYHRYQSWSAPAAPNRPVGAPMISTEEGTLTLCFLAPVEPGVGAVGIYFPEGQLGVLYAPLIAKGGTDRFRGVSISEFAELVENRYGVVLEGADSSGSGFVIHP